MAQKTRRISAKTIVPTAGVRSDQRLKNGFKGYYVRATARAHVSVTVAPATALRNRGSVWALYDEVGLDENGTDRHIYDGPSFRQIAEMHAPSALSAVRAAAAIGEYDLEEDATMFFSHPLSASPEETVFRERDAREILSLFLKYNGNTGSLFTVGPATVVITVPSVTIRQIVDDRSPNLPLFIATARQVTHPVAGALANEPIYLKTSKFLRAILIKQEVTSTVNPAAVEVTDILTSLALRGDNRDIIGPQEIPVRDLILDQEAEFGGVVVNGGYVGFNFQDAGKLSNVVNPGDDVNLRLEVTAAPSAFAGGGSSRLRITLLELERTAGLVAPELPFPI